MQLSPYLMFDDTCEAAFKFYESMIAIPTESVLAQ